MPLHARGHEVTIEPQPTDSQYLGACSRNRNRTASVFMHGIMQPVGIWRSKHADEAEPLGSILSLLINLLTMLDLADNPAVLLLETLVSFATHVQGRRLLQTEWSDTPEALNPKP